MTRWFEKIRQRISFSNKGKPNKPKRFISKQNSLINFIRPKMRKFNSVNLNEERNIGFLDTLHEKREEIIERKRNSKLIDICLGYGNDYDIKMAKYRIMNELGSGKTASVYSVRGGKAMKIQMFKKRSMEAHFKNEVKITKRLSLDYNIGPRYIDSWICKNRKVISGYISLYMIFEKMEKCLSKFMYIDKHSIFRMKENVVIKSVAYEKIRRDINTMHDIDIAHFDLMPKNIMVNTEKIGDKTVITRMEIIDFGISCYMKDSINNIPWLDKLYYYHRENYDFLMDSLDYDMYLDDPRAIDLIFFLMMDSFNSEYIVD